MSTNAENCVFVNDSAKQSWDQVEDRRHFITDSGESMRRDRIQQSADAIRRATRARGRHDPGFTEDAVEGAGAVRRARELEYTYNEVLEEEYAPNNGLQYFPVDESVPAGARSHVVERVSHTGNARVYRGGHSEPKGSTGVQKASERFPVLTYVTEIELDFFERQSDSFAGTNLRAELEMAAQQTLMDFLNEKTFDGSPQDDLRGIWEYPFLPRTVSGVAFDGSAAPEDMLDELHRLANLLAEESKKRYSPTTLLTSIRVKHRISNKKRSGTTDETVEEAFLSDNEYIDEVVGIHEARGIGPNGEDAMLFYDRGNRMSVANSLVQGFEMLPIQEEGFNLRIPCYIQHGGIIMRNALNNLLTYVDGGS
jgi:hypothetical protein